MERDVFKRGVFEHANVGKVGMDMSVKFGDYNSNCSREIKQRSRRVRHFRPFLKCDNCQPEVVIDVISGMADQDAGMDARANF